MKKIWWIYNSWTRWVYSRNARWVEHLKVNQYNSPHEHNKGEKACGPSSRGEEVHKKCNTHLGLKTNPSEK